MQNLSRDDVRPDAYRLLVATLHRRRLTIGQANALRELLRSLLSAVRTSERGEDVVLGEFARQLAALVGTGATR